jgi:hypothetical protein
MRLPALPSGVGAFGYSAGHHVQVVAALGSAACGLAGAYPRFQDDAVLRIVIAVASAVFGALVLRMALSAQTRSGAVCRALAMSTVFGVAATVVPSAILAAGEQHGSGPGVFLLGILFGCFFGAPTGFAYGLFLASLAGITYRSVASSSFDGADRAARAAGLWLVVPATLSLVPSLIFDLPSRGTKSEIAHDDPGIALALALLASVLTLSAAICSVLWAHLRVRRRRAWIAAVREGRDNTFRLRDVDPRDDVQTLPVLTAGTTVIEWVPDAQHATAYRDAPNGVAVALVAERPLTR